MPQNCSEKIKIVTTMTIEYEDLVLGAVESEVDVEWEGGGDGEGEVGHRGHQVHPARPQEVLGIVRVKI